MSKSKQLHALLVRSLTLRISNFFIQNEHFFIPLDKLTESSMQEYDSITASHKHRKHSSLMVVVADS